MMKPADQSPHVSNPHDGFILIEKKHQWTGWKSQVDIALTTQIEVRACALLD